ncbi:hypothetical protein [Candidatus Caldatribacterium saccharofermentans]|uniref:Uncharacterized protein n=1 Tax=Candidatus Caldatribacterium saccharofermentans TaxID=1454753 RepID=A0A7V4WJT6_9BACT
MRRTAASVLLALCILCLGFSAAKAETRDYEKIYKDTVARWTRSVTVRESFAVSALFWNEEVTQAWVAKYGKENLLSSEEELAYHRDFIQRERLNRYLVFEVTLKKLKGAPLYPLRFAQNTYLVDDKGRKIFPADYDKGFEEKILREFTGKIYFPRFDKDGNPFITPETRYIVLHLSQLSPEASLFAHEVELRFDDPYIPPDFSRPEWKPVLEEEILRLEERLKDLEYRKKQLEENLRQLEEEERRVQERLEELKRQRGQ